MMLALRDFSFINQMYALEPNVTLLLFTFFVIAVMYFMANIFISLVILIFNEVMRRDKAKQQKTPEQILHERHWSLKLKGKCTEYSRKCNCCNKKRRQANEGDDEYEATEGGARGATEREQTENGDDEEHDKSNASIGGSIDKRRDENAAEDNNSRNISSSKKLMFSAKDADDRVFDGNAESSIVKENQSHHEDSGSKSGSESIFSDNQGSMGNRAESSEGDEMNVSENIDDEEAED